MNDLMIVATALALTVAIIFNSMVKRSIQDQVEFSGTAWGIINGIIGVGLLFVIIAHNSINSEIAKIKNKKYKEYAIGQMHEFIKAYFICVTIWAVILFVMPTIFSN